MRVKLSAMQVVRLASAALLVYAVVDWSCTSARPRMEHAAVWNALRGSMMGYYFDNGVYPYEPNNPESALYALKPYYEIVRSTVVHELRNDIPEEDAPLSLKAGRGSEPLAAPKWDDREKRVRFQSVEYANVSPEYLTSISESIVLLSYDTNAWSRCEPLPLYSSPPYEILRGNPQIAGYYIPWVRPTTMVGLSMQEVLSLSSYGRNWGVTCERAR